MVVLLCALEQAERGGVQPLIGRLRLAGILTKPDLVDRGTESKVVDVAQNLVCHLKKGYMIVKCRGQQDIQDQVTLAEALQKERDFFEEHPHFRYPAVFSQGRTKTWGEGCCPKADIRSVCTLAVIVGVPRKTRRGTDKVTKKCLSRIR